MCLFSKADRRKHSALEAHNVIKATQSVQHFPSEVVQSQRLTVTVSVFTSGASIRLFVVEAVGSAEKQDK